MRTARAENLMARMKCLNCGQFEVKHFGEEIRSFCSSCLPECYEPTVTNQEEAHILVIGGVESLGYPIALKYLRSGAQVTVASRLPQLFAEKLFSESNHEEWNHRLTLIGLDLLDYSGLEEFLQFLELRDQTFSQIYYCTPTLPFSDESVEPAEAKCYPLARDFRSSLQSQLTQSWAGRTTALMVTIPSIIAQRIDTLERRKFVFRVLLQCGSLDLTTYDWLILLRRQLSSLVPKHIDFQIFYTGFPADSAAFSLTPEEFDRDLTRRLIG